MISLVPVCLPCFLCQAVRLHKSFAIPPEVFRWNLVQEVYTKSYWLKFILVHISSLERLFM